VLGLAILILGAWGGIVPFVGPAFGYPMPPGSHIQAWTWTPQHAELHVAAGGAAFIGGLLLLAAAPRAAGRLGAWLGLVGGAWFVLGPVFSPAFSTGGGGMAGPASTFMRVVTPLGYHYGTGLVIVVLSAVALALLARVRPVAGVGEPPVRDRRAEAVPVAQPYGRPEYGAAAPPAAREREPAGIR
jgi:hypothetical protein